MTIKVTCNGCNKTFQVDEKFIGKKGQCPKCKNIFEVKFSDESDNDDTKEVSSVIVHEQDIGHITEEKKGLFSNENMSKVIIGIVFIAVAGWNIYAYFHNAKVDKIESFIAIYNKHITLIQGEILGIESELTNKMEIEILAIEKELKNIQESVSNSGKYNNNSKNEINISNTTSILEKITLKYQSIYSHLDIIENQACSILPTSSEECTSFIVSYRKMIHLNELGDYDSSEKISVEVNTNSERFRTAAMKDGVEI